MTRGRLPDLMAPIMPAPKTLHSIRSVIWILVPVTIVAGQWFPLLGFVVPVVMLSAIFTSYYKRGRYFCASFCPRGAFYDRVVVHLSPGRRAPLWFRSAGFRWAVVILLLGAMAYQISLNPGDVHHWGRVFVRVCLLTTLLGVALALLSHPRTWCSFCPMGTIQGAIGKRRAEPSRRDASG